MSDAPPRSQVDDRYRWDHELVFDGPGEWERAADRLAARLDELDPVDESVVADGETLLSALRRRDELRRDLGPVRLYPRLRALVDTTDDEARDMQARARRLRSTMDAAFAGLEPAVARAGRARVEAFLADTPGLAEYDHELDDVLRRRDHVLSPAEEELLATVDDALSAPARTLETIAEHVTEPPTLSVDGEDVTVTRPVASRYARHPDRDVRRRVHRAYRESLREDRVVTARAYAEHLRSYATRAEARNYDSPVDMAMADLPADCHGTVAETVRENLGPFDRRLALLRERLDVDELRDWDRNAPLVPGDGPTVAYDDAADVVLDAVAPLGEDYRDRLAAILDEPRVDVYETRHKRNVRAMLVEAYGEGSFVHLNYDGSLQSLFFFVHELGHAMHREYFAESQPTPYQTFPDVAEVASFCHEALLVRHLLDSFEDPTDRAHVVDAFTQKLPIQRAARGMAFVRRLFEDVEADRTLTADRIDEHQLETMEAYFGPVDFEPADACWWLNLDLDREPFHAYLYAVGATGGLATARRLLDGDLSPGAYREFLRAGSSEYATDLLSRLDLSVADGELVAVGIEEYGRYVDELADGLAA